MKKMFFATMFAMILFASCENENVSVTENLNEGETKNVYLKLTQAPSVRAVTDAVADRTVEFSSGDLYFVTATGAITKHFTITPGNTDQSNLNLTDLTSTSGISGIVVPGSSKYVYVAGNTPAGVNLPTSGAYSEVENVIVSAASQKGVITNGKAIEGVMLYSNNDKRGELVKSGDIWTAEVKPMQIANRLEITDISAKTGGGVTGFTVEGIYVNNFYKQKKVGVNSHADDLVNYKSVASNYDGAKGLYASEGAGVFYDEPGTNAVSLTAAAGEDKVWGYNLLEGNEVPHIVIKLSNITVDNGYKEFPENIGFITVTGFLDGNDPIDFSKGGQIFTVDAGGLQFELKDITTEPELGKINAKVTVELTEWKPISVIPVI